VLCRNVLIYFSHEWIVRFLDRLADWMLPGGWLFLGYSESLWQVTERFELVRVGDAFLYRCAEARSHRRQEGPPLEPQTSNRDARRPSRQQLAKRRAAAASLATPSSVVRTRRTARAAAQRDADEGSKAEVAGLMATGEAAVQAGDYAAAITAFRKYAYLDPAQPIAHLHLGLALDASGDTTAARRAYAAARSALGASEAAMLEETLGGYGVDELSRLLDMKLASS
jgi:chemotaxis protein methyltransferase CheR